MRQFARMSRKVRMIDTKQVLRRIINARKEGKVTITEDEAKALSAIYGESPPGSTKALGVEIEVVRAWGKV